MNLLLLLEKILVFTCIDFFYVMLQMKLKEKSFLRYTSYLVIWQSSVKFKEYIKTFLPKIQILQVKLRCLFDPNPHSILTLSAV